MDHQLYTTGEFARLAVTTKRTVQFYEEKGLLKPYSVNEKGYRFYNANQIVDFQLLLLLRKLNFSIEEIKNYSINNKYNILFKKKEKELIEKIADLKESLESLKKYYKNLDKNNLLVNPVIKECNELSIYYIDKTGPYIEEELYFNELKSLFFDIPNQTIFVTIYEEEKFNPKNAKMKIGIVKNKNLKVKDRNKLKEIKFDKFKVLSYIHNGPTRLLSLMWIELLKYQKVKNLKQNKKMPYFFEFYLEKNQIEIQIPLEI